MVYSQSKHKGFTLIELMVVLVIVGIITAMASLAFYRADSERGMVALTTFNRALIAMREQAILRQHALGVYLIDDGYTVYEIHTNPKGDLVKTTIPNNSLNLPDAFAGRWHLTMQKGAFMAPGDDGNQTQPKDQPILAISSDGVLTPLAFTFGPKNSKPWWAVTVPPNGVGKIIDLRKIT
jgi:general secretion pathway protein H